MKSLVVLETTPTENGVRGWEIHTVKLNDSTVIVTHVFGSAVAAFTGMRNDLEKLQQCVEDRAEELCECIHHDLRMGRPELVKIYAEELIKLMNGLEHESARIRSGKSVSDAPW